MDVREKLVELIGSTEYGNGSLVGKNFQKGFIEKIASNLIANGVTVQEWISVKDRLPEPLTQVLSYGHGCFEVNMVDGGVWDSEYYSEYSVTHWMPLPQPPKGE